MKRVLFIMICISLISALAVTTVFADSERIDIRDLEEYGQPHYYLGAPAKVRPDVEDACVKENEYAVSYEFKPGEQSAFEWPKDSPKYYDNEWVKVHMSYDEMNLYLAIETKDKNYIKGSDGFSFNITFRDRGIGYDAISRMCFDIFQHPEAEADDISTFNTRCRFLIKNEKGEWENPPQADGLEYITDISGKYDESTQVFTVELEMYLKQLLRFWENDQPLEEVRMGIYPLIWMYGESTKGAGDTVQQGLLWNYYKVSNNQKLAAQFQKDYNYTPPWVPNIVHFCEDPAFTTTPPSTTEPNTTTGKLENPFTTERPFNTMPIATTTPETTVADQKGCGATLSVALIPLALAGVICLISKRKED